MRNPMFFLVLASSVIVVCSLAAPAAAFGQYRTEVPNGGVGSCQTCHQRSSGGRPWQAFGDLLFTSNGGTVEQPDSINASADGFIWWNADICGADSDGDGQTNGQELGDPGCVWTGGDATRTFAISNPGDAASLSEDPDGEGDGAADGGGEGGGCFGSAQAAALLPALWLLGRKKRRP